MPRKFFYPVIRVLIVCSPERFEKLSADLGLKDLVQTLPSGRRIKLTRKLNGNDVRFHISFAHSVEEARKALRRDYFNVLTVDAGRLECAADFSESLAVKLRQAVRGSEEAERSWRWERTVVLIPNNECRMDVVFEIGRLGMGSYELLPTTEERFFSAVGRIVERRAEVGKAALCLAGGGIEGMIFEMGVLRALNSVLRGRTVLDFDIYCGISAGAIVSCMLANGVPPEQFIKAFEKDSTSIAPIVQSTIFDFDVREYLGRLWHMVSGLGRLKKGPAGLLALGLRSIPVGFFAGDKIEAHLLNELGRAGRTNDFRKLEKELYIGSTDQDTSEHIVFGDEGWDDVPISDAVRASMALVPFYAPKWIRGRWFVDGSYTRTSELDVAVAKGAKMVVIIDPLVPIRSTLSGYVKAKGGVFSGIQGLKSLIHTRFSEGMARALEAYPDVDFYVFKPEQDEMRLMSGSPLKYYYRTEIERLGYMSTLERMEEDFAILKGDWQRHGFDLDREALDEQLQPNNQQP